MQSHCERCVWGCVSVRASGRSWLLRTVLRPRWDLEVPIRSSPVLCRGTAWGCCPSPHAESGLRAGRPVCQERGAQLHVCAAGRAAGCAGLAAGLCGKMEGQLLLLLPWLTQETPPLSWLCEGGRPARHKWLYCSEGCRHRGTGQPASLRRSRRPERHRSSTYRAILEVLSWSRRCVPVKKSRSSR